MLIVNKENSQVANMDNITDMYISDRNDIKLNYIGGSGCKIASYSSFDIAEEALSCLAEAANKGVNVFKFPADNMLETRLRTRNDIAWHHATGKKTKGHGGS